MPAARDPEQASGPFVLWLSGRGGVCNLRRLDMRLSLPLIAACALPLAACAASPYGYGYGSDPVYGNIGALGGAYGFSGMNQAGANACANYASRYGRSSVSRVQQLDANHIKVFGYTSRGLRNEGWDCTYRSDGRITDFDL